MRSVSPMRDSSYILASFIVTSEIPVKLSQVSVSYDHPFHASLEHAVNLDFVNEKEGWGKRVAVEITPESARQLVQVIERALARSEPS